MDVSVVFWLVIGAVAVAGVIGNSYAATKKNALIENLIEKGQPIPQRGEGMTVDFAADEPLMVECRHFLNCVRTRSTPLTDGRNGLAVLQVLHAAQRSLTTNGHPTQITASRSIASPRSLLTQPDPAATVIEPIVAQPESSNAWI